MNYYDWYVSKYDGTWIGYDTGTKVIAAKVVSVDCEEDCEERHNVILRLADTDSEEIGYFSADHESLIYKLPMLNRFYLSENLGLVKIVQRANHQWRYGMRHNSFQAVRIASNGRWMGLTDSQVRDFFNDMYADKREIDGVGKLLLADLAVQSNNVYSMTGIVGRYDDSGLRLLDNCAILLPKITEKGIEINGFISKNTTPTRNGGSGDRAGESATSSWERILEQYRRR